jgi:hypothetical protein
LLAPLVAAIYSIVGAPAQRSIIAIIAPREFF